MVALLFSDVLLLTKVQKKGERLKVVRPPLALDRMHCIQLKDGCELLCRTDKMPDICILLQYVLTDPLFSNFTDSFLLVEVGELQTAMNVYILVASASDSCSTWVSTIHKAKVNLAL